MSLFLIRKTRTDEQGCTETTSIAYAWGESGKAVLQRVAMGPLGLEVATVAGFRQWIPMNDGCYDPGAVLVALGTPFHLQATLVAEGDIILPLPTY